VVTQSLIDISDMLPAVLTAPGMTEEEFIELCEKFPDALLEYTPEGTVLIMPPTDPETSARVAEIIYQLAAWARTYGGMVIGPDGGFLLPSGSRRSPDAAWFDTVRWNAAKRPGTRFPAFAPEFAIEMRSPHDKLAVLRDKMNEYLANGVQLAWLVDPKMRTVTIYRPDHEPEELANPSEVAGEGPVAGFVLSLDRIFTH
jgi:Uma2 family endonuclease